MCNVIVGGDSRDDVDPANGGATACLETRSYPAMLPPPPPPCSLWPAHHRAGRRAGGAAPGHQPARPTVHAGGCCPGLTSATVRPAPACAPPPRAPAACEAGLHRRWASPPGWQRLPRCWRRRCSGSLGAARCWRPARTSAWLMPRWVDGWVGGWVGVRRAGGWGWVQCQSKRCSCLGRPGAVASSADNCRCLRLSLPPPHAAGPGGAGSRRRRGAARLQAALRTGRWCGSGCRLMGPDR